MHYETLKHSGDLPIIGVNTFLNPETERVTHVTELIRSTEMEKQQQITNLKRFAVSRASKAEQALQHLQTTVLANENIFEALMETVKHCSLGAITQALYQVGGQYRRNM
jgi:methylmalonyl-CoA mutase